MDHPFTFRPGTLDESMFNAVCLYNEYELPEAFRPDDLIVDVGMNIGSFCYAALTRGAGRVVGFEAEAANYECAVRNLRTFAGRVEPVRKAIWRSDRPATTLKFFRSPDAANTGGGNVIWDEGEQVVEAIPFDDAIRDATRGGKQRVRLLKIDCEGSEFPILFTSRTLHLIDQVVGEFHEFHGDHDEFPIPAIARVDGFDRFTIVELTAVLRRAGFDVRSERFGETNMGHFFATRRPRAPHPLTRRFWGGQYRRLRDRISARDAAVN